MEVQQDFRELLELFIKHEVEFVLVGAYALAFYGVPRFTGDLDILVKPSVENANKILKALKDFGFGSLTLNSDDFLVEKQVIQLGQSPVRIDLLTSISGVDWETVNAGKTEGCFGNLKVYFIGSKEFVKNKIAIGRYKDLADIESLKKLELQ